MGYLTATFVFIQKKGGVGWWGVDCVCSKDVKRFLQSLLGNRGKMTRELFKKKESKGKLNSCCHDIHVFMPARRQFSVQTGVVWKGVIGILLDTETAKCHMCQNNKKGRKKKKEKKERKDKETFLINAPFFQKKATHFRSVKKNHKLSRKERERSRVLGICDKAVRSQRLLQIYLASDWKQNLGG